MFGESDSESPRVPSPWDLLTSGPSYPRRSGIQATPKLVPEIEEGNIEYKLQLLSPSPARFARLVTQLKWRLLEGGGKAYYELGVADSGTLVGLPRQQLEESLETLEMMAGEIGASVIVVKEIEVAPELSSLAESQLERLHGRRSTRRKDFLRVMKQAASSTSSPAEFETELSTTDITDGEESTCYSSITPPDPLGNLVQSRPFPDPLPFDSALAVFTMDFGEDTAGYCDNEISDGDVLTDFVTETISAMLEISCVYKPRPTKKRAIHIESIPSAHFEYAKKKLKNGCPSPKPTDPACRTGDLIAQDFFETPLSKGEGRHFRKTKGDSWQELEHNALLTHAATCRSTESSANSAHHHIIPCSGKPDPSTLEPLHTSTVDLPAGDALGTASIASKEPRLIVEALVVWELSSDEAFLDFEGFS